MTGTHGTDGADGGADGSDVMVATEQKGGSEGEKAPRYRWIEGWASVPDPGAAEMGWAHPGVAVTDEGLIVTCHPSQPLLCLFRPDGTLARSVMLDATEAHGIAVSGSGETQRIWVADSGAKRMPGPGYPAMRGERGGQVLELDLEGRTLRRFDAPPHDAYGEGAFSPTSVAVDGRDGTVWIADGYGQSLVHRYDQDGTYRSSLTGEEGAGRFKTPHAVIVDTRRGEPELYVADRANARIQVYDAAGRYRRVFGEDVFVNPTAFALSGELLVVADLRGACVALFDASDRCVALLGDDRASVQKPGWPNRLDGAGEPVRPADLVPGRFNSPHGVGADEAGNLYVAEWLIGGRYTKLEALPA